MAAPAKITIGMASLCRPASTTRAKPSMETPKPASPVTTIFLRPTRSDRVAQKGAERVQNRADRVKIAAISVSRMPISRPIAGKTDCIEVLPAATLIKTQNRMMKDRRRVCSGVEGKRPAKRRRGSRGRLMARTIDA